MEKDGKGTDLGNVIRIDNERVRDHFGRIVQGTVEETLNAMLDAEADRLCGAGTPTSRTCPPWRLHRCPESPENPRN